MLRVRSLVRSLGLSAALSLAGLALAGCGGPLEYVVRGTEISAGSDAKITATVEKDKGMTTVVISATNVTPPSRLLEGGTLLVMWARKNDAAAWLRLGGLDYDEGARTAKGEKTVGETAFDLLVTAEKTVDAASPSGKIVFQQRVQGN